MKWWRNKIQRHAISCGVSCELDVKLVRERESVYDEICGAGELHFFTDTREREREALSSAREGERWVTSVDMCARKLEGNKFNGFAWERERERETFPVTWVYIHFGHLNRKSRMFLSQTRIQSDCEVTERERETETLHREDRDIGRWRVLTREKQCSFVRRQLCDRVNVPSVMTIHKSIMIHNLCVSKVLSTVNVSVFLTYRKSDTLTDVASCALR